MSANHPSLFYRVFFGYLLPAGLIAVGVGVYITLGKAEPKQVMAPENSDEAILLRLPIADARRALPFDGERTLDIELNGVVVPFREVTIAAEVQGRVCEKSEFCKGGKFVKAGQILFRIEPRDYQLEVDRLTHLKEQEYAQLREWEQEVANIKRSLDIANQELLLQEKEVLRLETLPQGIASASEIDQARRARLTIANQRQTVQNQFDLLIAREKRLQLSQQLAATQLEQAKLNLSRTEIKAPIDGVILSENVEVDSYVQRGATLCLIEDTSKVEVRCNLRMDQMVTILDHSSNDPLTSAPLSLSRFELPDSPVTVVYRVAGREDLHYEWKGRLSRYDGIGLDPQSRTVPCRITVDHPSDFTVGGKPSSTSPGSPSALVRGMFVEAKIHTTPKRKLMLIPKLALRPGNIAWKFVEENSREGTGHLTSAPPSQVTVHQVGEKVQVMNREWIAGNLTVLRGIQVLRPYRRSVGESKEMHEYWIVEARDDLDAGDLLIVTPLVNVQEDGSERVRLPIRTLQDGESTSNDLRATLGAKR